MKRVLAAFVLLASLAFPARCRRLEFRGGPQTYLPPEQKLR
jgi:hypothetical protein